MTMKNIYSNTRNYALGIIASAALLCSCENKPVDIKEEGFPKGYQIKHADIPTRGTVIRVKKLPGEAYKVITTYPNKHTKKITYEGNFEYEIKPMMSAAPKDAEHSDMNGHTLDNNAYWTATREGTIEGTIEDTLNIKKK